MPLSLLDTSTNAATMKKYVRNLKAASARLYAYSDASNGSNTEPADSQIKTFNPDCCSAYLHHRISPDKL